MQSNSINTFISTDSINTFISTEPKENIQVPIEDYSAILKNLGLDYKPVDYYWQIGNPENTQGWILHISIIAAQLADLLNTILPLLIFDSVPFKVAINKDIAKSILNGQLGYIQLGKVISIYPGTDNQALELAHQLLEMTKPFKGPKILTDRHLGGVIYTRYGAHNAVKRTGESSNLENYIYDALGNLIKDQYTIPFILPAGVSWPFSSIASPIVSKVETILQDRYKPMAILKEDARGNVKKSLRLEKWWRVKWCLIKEGRQNMFSDEHGRDIRARLEWQYELHNDLFGTVPIPKVYELFEENGDSYLSMEFIKGESLDNVVTNIFQDRHWASLLLSDRLQLIAYALQLLDIVDKMHKKGYVHRDINPGNFLVIKSKTLVMIDLELAYSVNHQKPTPPFRYGTAWFMSPEQEATQTPTFKEDIYAVGVSLIVLLTGSLPSKFSISDPGILKKELMFFNQDIKLAEILADCFLNNPPLRPTLNTLKKEIQRFKSGQSPVLNLPAQKPDAEAIELTIDKAIQALATPSFVTEDNLWWSKTMQEESLAYYQAEGASIYGGFFVGVSGISYVLAKAHKAGFSIRPCMKAYNKSQDFIRNQYLEKPEQIPGGLYTGSAGIALALIEGLESGLLPNAEKTTKQILDLLFTEKLQGLGVVNGIAGQGIALLRAAALMDDPGIKSRLNQHVNTLLENQQKDGSWIIMIRDGKDQVKITGFGHGIAGIICFLAGYARHYKNAAVEEAIDKSLNWLIRQSYKKQGGLIWNINNRSKITNPGMQDGWAGVLLAFIEGYRLLKDQAYQKVVETAFNNYPSQIIARDFSLISGLVGLGEVYLTAYKTFESERWLQRADWITQFLLHQFQQRADGSCLWMMDHTPVSTADLMTGNTGILHYLIRYKMLFHFSHPLLPIS
jgi:serine/threonine protein kinase